MKRREFLGFVGGAAAWPLVASAQQPRKPHRLAFVHSGIPAEKLTKAAGPFWIGRFHETLERLGYSEGGNLVVERYSADGNSDRFTALAAEVVSRKPDVIVSNFTALVRTFLAATDTIPIVGITTDPKGSQAGQCADRATHQIRITDQYEDGEGPRRVPACNITGHSRRGNPISLTEFRSWRPRMEVSEALTAVWRENNPPGNHRT